MKTNCGIYKITNLIPNKITGIHKVYIGSSENLKSRKWHHFWSLEQNRHRNKHLQSAVKIDGIENFKFEVILCLEKIGDKRLLKEMILKEEQKEIDKYKSENGDIDHDRCYNLSPTAGSPLGIKLSEEHRIKTGIASKGRKKSKENIEKDRVRMLGNTYYKSRINWNHSKETKIKISKSHKGRKHTEESKKNMSISSTCKKKVINLTTRMEFSSITEASNYYNINRSDIRRACRGECGMGGGYKWSFVGKVDLKGAVKFIGRTKLRKVINLDTQEIFGSIVEASKCYGINNAQIGKVCMDKGKTAGGYKWAYLDNDGEV